MPGLSGWDPYRQNVQGGLRPGNFVNGQFVLICAGPPFLEDVGAGVGSETDAGAVDVVYPIGLTQNFTLSQNKAISRIFEIGSDRSYFITGRTVGQMTLFRVMYHGPSILRALWAYYSSDGGTTGVSIDPLYQSLGAANPNNFPFSDTGNTSAVPGTGTQAAVAGGLHEVQIPPGYDNVFINLASDLFSQPIGILLVVMDNAENNVAYAYMENCHVPSYTLALDSQGLILQESVGIQYERIVPIRVNAVKLLDKVLPDVQGGAAY